MTLVLALLLGEGLRDVDSGALFVQRGYLGHVDATREIVFDINTVIVNPDSIRIPSLDELRMLVRSIDRGTALWRLAPHTRVKVRGGRYRIVRERFLRDQQNLMSLTDSLVAGGQAVPWGERTPDGPVIVESDILIRTDMLDSVIKCTRIIVHEVGHTLGFNHSWLSRKAFMGDRGWDGRLKPDVEQGRISTADDLAIVADLYPDPRNRISRTHGTIRGRAWNGTRAVSGASILILSGNEPILHGVSGYRAGGGQFSMSGIPPGTYTVVLTSQWETNHEGSKMYEARIEPSGMMDHTEIPTEFVLRGVVRNVSIRAGETVDLGYALAGVERDYREPSLHDIVVAVPPGYYWNWVRFRGSRSIVHNSGWFHGTSYAARLPNDLYSCEQYAWNGSRVAHLRTYIRDYRAREVDLRWDRKIFGSLEATRYFVFLYGAQGFAFFPEGWEAYRYLLRGSRVDGTSYRVLLPPGDYYFCVAAQEDLSRPWTWVQGWRRPRVE